jgi:hypothetical protein
MGITVSLRFEVLMAVNINIAVLTVPLINHPALQYFSKYVTFEISQQ